MNQYQKLVAIRSQCNWILEHGGDERGYVSHYGLFGRTEDEARAIYRADWNELQRAIGRLQ